MAQIKKSSFIYGHTITDDNSFINFTENGIDELSSTIEIGSFTISTFIDAVAVALNEIGDNTYTVSLDRTTRKITISADANFDLLVTTGTQSQISAFSLMGFTSDKSGSNSYEADEASGSIYLPQTKLFGYVPFEHNQSSVQSKVNESSSGDIELVTYGERRFAKFNIKYISNITGQNFIEDNPNAVQDVTTFMEYIRLKRPFEFLPDRDDVNTFYSVILESTPQGATDYELTELYAESLAFYFETGTITLRQIEV
jgi:hypothetical protein